MKCPACSGELSAVIASSATLDVCAEHCGGVWFDRKELERFDDAAEPIAPNVLRAVKNSDRVIDPNRERFCPKCSAQKLAKRYFDSQHNVQIDECESCNGIWLDLGELHTLRMQNKTASERSKIVSDYANANLGKENVPRGVQAVFKLLF